MNPNTQFLLTVLDLIGTLVFAITGAFRAVKYELDILGVLVLSVFTGVGGGILRDLILGQTPPSVFVNEIYFILCIAGGLLVFFLAPHIARRWPVVKAGDALGLGVFAALGALKAYHGGLGPIGVIMVGSLTAVGGGMIRDILVREIPSVIRTDFYATAAGAGALVLWLLKEYLGLSDEWALLAAFLVTLGLRLAAMIFQFSLPKVKRLPAEPSVLSLRPPKPPFSRGGDEPPA